MPEADPARAHGPWWRWPAAAALAVSAVALLWGDRRDLPSALSSVRSARPLFVITALALVFVAMASQAVLHAATQRAVGIDADAAALLEPAAAASFCNLTTKSGGMAGLVPLSAAGRRRGVPASRTVAAYVLANVVGHLAFAATLGTAMVVLVMEHRLPVGVTVACAAFAVLTGAQIGLLAAAVASDRVADRAHAARAALARRRGRPVPARPSELDQTVVILRELRADPKAIAAPFGAALLVELVGMAQLWAVLHAVGARPGLTVPLVAYAVSVLFAVVGFLPGGIGFVEAGLGGLLVSFGLPTPRAAAVVVLYRMCELWLPAAIGAVALRRGRRAAADGALAGAARPPGDIAGGRAAQWNAGRTWRRGAAAAVGTLAILDAALAVAHRPVLHVAGMVLQFGYRPHELLRYVLLLTAMALLSSIRGLLHGKRAARIVALVATAVSMTGGRVISHEPLRLAVVAVAATLLLAGRRAFPARADRVLARQGVAFLVLGGGAVYAYGVTGLYLLDSHFRHSTTFVQSLGEAARLLFLLPSGTITPISRHGQWFIDSVRVLAAAVLVVAIARLARSVVERGPVRQREVARVQSILEASATNGLSHFLLLDDKHYLFSEDRRGVVGYKVVGRVAVALAEPVGPPDAARDAALRFLDLCALNGWTPAFHQVSEAGADLLRSCGLTSLKVGETAIVDVVSFSLEGSHFKTVRSKTAKLRREGWTVELLAELDQPTMDQLREVSDAWLAHGGHRERTFSLGRFDPEAIEAGEVLAVRNPDGAIDAFATILPSYRSGLGNFDLMRHRPDSHRSVMDLLFVELIELFRSRGLQGMDLGMAPFANVEGDTVPDRAVRLLYEHGGRLFNAVGLRSFKDKWRPRWEPRYLMYRTETELAAVSLATARAGELPHADTSRLELASGVAGKVARGAVTVGRRVPFTVTLGTAVLVLELVARLDGAAGSWLQRNLRYDWADIVDRGQLHRLLTAVVVQAGHIPFGTVPMIVMLGIGEAVIGTRHAIPGFVVGDLGSSLPVLLVLRIAASDGSRTAATLLATRDGGMSSGLFAVCAAGLVVLGRRRRRLALAGAAAMAGYLCIGVLAGAGLAECQHLLAAVIGVLLALAWHRRGQRGATARMRPQAMIAT